ncbi:MAG: hypothetical protein CL470_05330 [Acidimicrobiaceae bacterium]|nr:hypothetical protein [Acidimicrobiaceae bacterium]|tara:strand:- start:372 stop:788 length:417 start_codon:yes stop_codon:yes gene_type:complete
MSQNISFIKKELKNCEEINSPYELILNNIVKYITIKNDEEFFYIATYLRMGDNKIFVKNDKGKIYPVQLIYYDKLGNHLYKTRLFIEDKNQSCNQSQDENEKIIQNQQMIIEKMNLQLKKQNKLIKELHQRLIKGDYE